MLGEALQKEKNGESRIGIERIGEKNRTTKRMTEAQSPRCKRTWRLGKVDGRLSRTIEKGRKREEARHLI